MMMMTEKRARCLRAKPQRELCVHFTHGHVLTAITAMLKTTCRGTSAIAVVLKSQGTTHSLSRTPVESIATARSMTAALMDGVKFYVILEVALLAQSM